MLTIYRKCLTEDRVTPHDFTGEVRGGKMILACRICGEKRTSLDTKVLKAEQDRERRMRHEDEG
jgi:hypothetical protein